MAVLFGIDERLDNMTVDQREALLGIGLLAPSALLICIVVIYPLFYNVYLSFMEVPPDPTQAPEFIGLAHYQQLFADPVFWSALRNTVIFTALSDLGALSLGVVAAVLLNRAFRGQKIVRGMMLLPYVAPIIAVAFAWRWMLNPSYGIVTYTLVDLLNFLTPQEASNYRHTIWTVIIFDTWRYFPFAFLMIMARLKSIPPEMYEAARIDGAGWFSQFKDITLPELKYVLATIFMIRWIWNFNKFADIWLLTNEVNVMSIYTFLTAFNQFNLGRASAIAMLLFVFLMIYVVAYVRWVLEW